MIELYVLNELAAFSKYGTLTAVAEHLNVSQPALSRSMKKLESDIGVKLFERGKNKIALNENGRLAAKYAQKVIDAETLFEQKVVEYERLHRVFRFGGVAPIPLDELAPIISRLFVETSVESELKDNERDLYKGLDKGDYKLIVTAKPPKNAEKYFYIKLFTENLFIVLPDTHRLAKKKSVALKEMAGEKILVYDKIGFWYEATKRLIPDVTFLDQQKMSALRTLVDVAALPSFVTNFTRRTFTLPARKIAIPLSDAEVNVTFYCVCLKKNKSELAALFSEIKAAYAEKKAK